jgi:hypothetical protein
MLQGNIGQSMALSKAQNQYVLSDVIGLESLSSAREYTKYLYLSTIYVYFCFLL